MKNLFYTIFLLGILFTTVGCDKDKDEFIKTGDETIIKSGNVPIDTVWEDEINSPIPINRDLFFPIEKVNEQLQKPIYKDSFIAENGVKIVTPEDVIIEIPANSCTGENGICRGKLDIEFMILRTKGELMGNDKPTVSNQRLLISGGVVYIKIKQKGADVKLVSNKLVSIKYKMRPADPEMKLFEGKASDRFKFDWSLINTSTASGNVGVNIWRDTSTEQPIGYQLVTDRFGWLNCDKFNNETNLTNDVSIALPDSFTNRNTGVFLVFNDILSVVKLEGNPSTKRFSIPKNYKGVPIGKQVTVLVYAAIREKNYFSTQGITLAQTNATRIIPQAVAFDEIKRKISGL
jgi:hypothetical protein